MNTAAKGQVAMVPISIADQPQHFVRFAPDFGQRFIVTVDTEEEFDWDQPLSASGHTLHSVSRLAKFQQFCEGHGVVPVYLVDYPVATSRLAVEILASAVRVGKQPRIKKSPKHSSANGHSQRPSEQDYGCQRSVERCGLRD